MSTESAISKMAYRPQSKKEANEDTGAKSREVQRELMDVGCVTEQTKILYDNLRRRSSDRSTPWKP